MVNGTASLHLAGDPDPRLLKRMNGTVNISPRGRLGDRHAGESREPRSTAEPATGDDEERHSATASSRGADRGGKAVFSERSRRGVRTAGTSAVSSVFFQRITPLPSGTVNAKKASAVRDASLADLKVRVQLNNTSAAVVERTIPGLPIDITTGRRRRRVAPEVQHERVLGFP